MDKFKVIIAGTRDFNDYELLKTHMDKMLSNKSQTHEIIIVSGHARGADQLGERYARERGYELVLHPANWDVYGKRAGYLRNTQMAECSDALVAFWDGASRGTAHMISEAYRLNLQISIKKYKENNEDRRHQKET